MRHDPTYEAWCRGSSRRVVCTCGWQWAGSTAMDVQLAHGRHLLETDKPDPCADCSGGCEVCDR